LTISLLSPRPVASSVGHDALKYCAQLAFSTEILHDGQVSFNDGDVLLIGVGVVAQHQEWIKCFKPKADFVGLDALHKGTRQRVFVYLPIVLKNYR